MGAAVLKFFIDRRWGQRMRPGSGTDLLHQHWKASNVAYEATGNSRQHFVTFVNIRKTSVSS